VHDDQVVVEIVKACISFAACDDALVFIKGLLMLWGVVVDLKEYVEVGQALEVYGKVM